MAKKQKDQHKTNVMRILEQHQIAYTAHEYPHGADAVDGITVAHLLGQNPDEVFKTLVCQGHSGDYCVFVIPVSEELDLKKAAKAAGEKSVEMIHVKDINKVTGYLRGGCSPVGMKKEYRTFFHETAEIIDHIIVSGGKIGFQIETEPADLIHFVKGKTADLIKDKP